MGRGIATQAAFGIIQRAVNRRKHRFLHAFPSTSNPASNAVCQKVGFTNVGECTFEYPKGSFMRCNDWRVELSETPTLQEGSG
ncbi:MAG: GNAT family N-acetyltransferase [Candidatus Eremiobacteraeota bacterium]|nr:GNAT family N-acetyltransferase [Candidatus Eremiobacteraeota bacterium]